MFDEFVIIDSRNDIDDFESINEVVLSLAGNITYMKYDLLNTIRSYGLVLEKLYKHNFNYQAMYTELKEENYLSLFQKEIDEQEFNILDADLVFIKNDIVFKQYSSYLYIKDKDKFILMYLD